MQNPPAITLKRDRAQHWLSLGAKASDPVQRILDKQGDLSAATEEQDTEESAVEVEVSVAEETSEESEE